MELSAVRQFENFSPDKGIENFRLIHYQIIYVVKMGTAALFSY